MNIYIDDPDNIASVRPVVSSEDPPTGNSPGGRKRKSASGPKPKKFPLFA